MTPDSSDDEVDEQEDESSLRYRRKLQQATREKDELIASGYTVTRIGKKGDTYTWKVVAESFPNDDVVDYDQIGLRGIEFSTLFEQEFPLSMIFMKLWPGNWKQQLKNMNKAIENANENASRRIPLVSEYEWWAFISIMVALAAFNMGGERLWQQSTEYNFTPAPNVRDFLTLTRFK